MKLELPLAALLIAFGCWLWLSPVGRPTSALTPQTETQSATATPEDVFVDGPAPQRLPENTQPGIGATSHAGMQDPSSAPASPNGAVTRQVSRAAIPTLKSERLLAESAARLKSSPPLQANVRVSVNLFERTFSSRGSYIHAGQGSGKAKLVLQTASSMPSVRIEQVCDSRFYYRKMTAGEKTTIQFVDLQQVHETANYGDLPPEYSAGAPQGWIATGNVAGLMMHLSRCFEFSEPRESRIGPVPTMTLRGTWRPSALRDSLGGIVDPSAIEPEIQWDKIPDQIPGAVEIMLGHDDFVPLFPYRISFLRHDGQSSGSGSMQPLSTIEFFDLTILDTVSDDSFFVDSTDAETEDVTDAYVQQMSKRHEFAAQFRKQKPGDTNTQNVVAGNDVPVIPVQQSPVPAIQSSYPAPPPPRSFPGNGSSIDQRP